MRVHLTPIDPFRASRIAGIFGFLVGLAALPVLYYRFVVAPQNLGFSAGVILLVPFLVSGFAFAGATLGCILNNWLVRRWGGPEAPRRTDEDR